jgi:hypothetical protein
MQRWFTRTSALRTAVVVALLLLMGCGGPADPLDKVLDAAKPREYNRWWANHRPSFSSEIEERYLTAIQTLKLEMSIWPGGQSTADREADLNQELDRATIRQVIAYGEFVKINRSMIENYLDAQMLDLNRDQLDNVRPGSDLSISFSIEDQIRHLTERMTARKRKMDELTAKMQALLPDIHLDPWQSRPRNREDLPLQLVRERFMAPSALKKPDLE